MFLIFMVLFWQEISAFGVGRVVASGNEDFNKDDLVAGVLAWEEYTIVRPGTIINKISTTEFPLSYHLGVLGKLYLNALSSFSLFLS